MTRGFSRLILTVGAASALIAAQGALLATGAQAAAANVYLSGTTVQYDASSADNIVTITHVGTNIIIDDSFALTPGAGCWTVNSTKVACADGGVTGVRVYGNNGDDRINSAMDLNASLWGGDGDDVLSGGDGDDILRGEWGSDRMTGGAGRDGVSYYGRIVNVFADIDGATGDDGFIGEGDSIALDIEDLYGGEGHDTLRGDNGANYIIGNGGNDTIYGFGGVDTLNGWTGNDMVDGGDADDVVHGDDGDDTVRGWSGNDQLHGDDGDDRIEGFSGVDYLFGGDDNDVLDGQGDLDWLDGGPGGDICDDPTVWFQTSCE